ncbi:MAG: DUF2079 domain-containing protein [Gemmatimonadota bacterium]|nr:MAG: DUF2079 domain-containing protein [Gemmatimonadota bacterium]
MEYEIIHNIMRLGSFELKDEQFHEISAARGQDGKLYSPHGLGQSLIMLPFYYCGEGLAKLFPQFPEMRIHHFCISLMNPAITALTCTLVYLFHRKLGYRTKTAIGVSCIYGFCTLAFPYTKVSFDVTLTAFLLLSAAYSVVLFRQTFSSRWIFLSGILLGFSLLTRIASLLVLPFFSIYVYSCLKDNGRPFRSIGKQLILYALPILFFIILVGWYNSVRFGVFYQDGHSADSAVKLTTPVLVGVVGQLISPGKGLFLYSPILLFSFLGVRRFYHTHKREMLLFCSLICVNLLFYSKLSNWSGDWCWGPRFTLPIVPFFIIFIGCFREGIDFQSRTRLKRIWIVLLVLSFFVQVLGVTVDGTRRIGRRYESNTVSSTEVYWNPVKSPLIDHLQLITRISQKPTPVPRNESLQLESVSYEDTTADFWFVYLYSIGIPVRWILISLSFLIVLNMYFGYVIFQETYRRSCARC